MENTNPQKNDNQNLNEQTNTKSQQNIQANNQFSVPVAIVIAGILIALAIFYSNKGINNNTPTAGNNPSFGNNTGQVPQAPKVDVSNVDIKGEPFIGNPDAPLTIAYWLDFQCPFCKRFEVQTLPVLIDKYVKTGKVKIVFKDFQFLGPDSQDAGYVAKAVWELYPQYYFKWNEEMYKAQDAKNAGFGNLESILKLIREKIPEIDADKIAKRVKEKKDEYQKEQDQDRLEGSQFGINGTPGFIIGDQLVSGAQPTSFFTQVIDAQLQKLGKK